MNELRGCNAQYSRIALESDGPLQFWDFEEKLSRYVKMHLFTGWIAEEAIRDNTCLISLRLFGKRLNDGRSRRLIYSKQACDSFRFIGSYEAATAFFGPSWKRILEAKAFTLET